MEKAKRVLIAKNIIGQLEGALEAISFEGRICSKIGDEKGLDAIKKRANDLQKRIDAAGELLTEIEKEAPNA